jgi:hypothetical protein
MIEARRQLADSKRAAVLVEQVSNWDTANRIRAYCDAAEVAHAGVENSSDWISWAREYADSLDPLRDPPEAPVPDERVSPEELRPFLLGWSPYGAEQPARLSHWQRGAVEA